MSFRSGLSIHWTNSKENKSPFIYTFNVECSITVQLPWMYILFNVMVIIFIWLNLMILNFYSIHSIMSHRKMLTNINLTSLLLRIKFKKDSFWGNKQQVENFTGIWTWFVTRSNPVIKSVIKFSDDWSHTNHILISWWTL